LWAERLGWPRPRTMPLGGFSVLARAQCRSADRVVADSTYVFWLSSSANDPPFDTTARLLEPGGRRQSPWSLDAQSVLPEPERNID